MDSSCISLMAEMVSFCGLGLFSSPRAKRHWHNGDPALSLAFSGLPMRVPTRVIALAITL